MMRRLLAALALLWLAALPAAATLDRAICSTADAGSTCSGSEVITSTSEELAELYKRAPALLSSVAGTNTITASASPAITAYADGQVFWLQPAAANTGAVTLNIDGVGAAALTTQNGEALVSGMLDSGRAYLVRYRSASSHFRLATPGLTVSLQVFTSSGTWTKPSGLLYAIVTSTGAGGGGGGADATSATASYAAGGGGGGGGTCIEIFAASALGTTETVTIGAAGTAGSSSGGNGGNGGSTTFGALHTAAGGNGGSGANPGASTTASGAPGTGGGCTGGTVNLTAGGGLPGFPLDGPNAFIMITGGDGAPSYWGGLVNGGRVTASGSSAGSAGASPGSGGSGAAAHTTTSGAAGGAGGAGQVIVQEFRM